MYSVAVENYLKSIWELGPDDVATQDLAQLLNVAERFFLIERD